MSQISRDLTKEEKERRETVFVAVEKTFKKVREAVPIAEKMAVKHLLEAKLFPYVSSTFFNWKVDKILWSYGEKDAIFQFAEQPRCFGVPSSQTYIEAYFAANPTEEEKKAKDIKEARESQGQGNEQEAEQPVHIYQAQEPQSRAAVEEKRSVPLESKKKLHYELNGKAIPFLKGCGPFAVECPFSALGKEFEACFGPMKDLYNILMEATAFMGGNALNLVVNVRFRDLPDGDRRVTLFLDWNDKVSETDPVWRRSLYQAWCALLSLHNSQLQGVKVNLMDYLRQYYGGQMRDHVMLYTRIDATGHKLIRQANARRQAAEKLDGDKAAGEPLLEKMEKFSLELGISKIRNRIAAKNNLNDKVEALVELANSGESLYPIAEDPAVRFAMVTPTAEKVFTEQILLVLDPNAPLEMQTRLEQCISFVNNHDSPWEKLLPFAIRYEIISSAILDYKKEHDQTECFELIGRAVNILEACKVERLRGDTNMVES
ncbi:hypothetical protein F4678DRAFT_464251 [Xylaria arbuscula]|nr:hypothetical protein F4678DRAFT_464251 [Xylaria arbuscula]